MIKNFKRLFSLFTIYYLLFTGSVCFAADFQYQPMYLKIQRFANPTGVADLVNRIYLYALGLIAVFALGAIIYGAILWTTSAGNPSRIGTAKSWITGALLGLVLLLGAVILFNEINPNLNTLVEPTASMAPISTPTPSYSGLSSSTNPYDTPSEIIQGQGMSEEGAQDYIAKGWIRAKNTCPLGQSTGCVNLAGIRKATLDEAIGLGFEIGTANVYITGGIESGVHNPGEYSHANGYKIDLRKNSAIDYYVAKNFKYIGARSDGAPQYRAPSGAIYAFESGDQPHWDVLVK